MKERIIFDDDDLAFFDSEHAISAQPLGTIRPMEHFRLQQAIIWLELSCHAFYHNEHLLFRDDDRYTWAFYNILGHDTSYGGILDDSMFTCTRLKSPEIRPAFDSILHYVTHCNHAIFQDALHYLGIPSKWTSSSLMGIGQGSATLKAIETTKIPQHLVQLHNRGKKQELQFNHFLCSQGIGVLLRLQTMDRLVRRDFLVTSFSRYTVLHRSSIASYYERGIDQKKPCLFTTSDFISEQWKSAETIWDHSRVIDFYETLPLPLWQERLEKSMPTGIAK